MGVSTVMYYSLSQPPRKNIIWFAGWGVLTKMQETVLGLQVMFWNKAFLLLLWLFWFTAHLGCACLAAC